MDARRFYDLSLFGSLCGALEQTQPIAGMAPISADQVDDLKAQIAKLETRVRELEGKAAQKAGAGNSKASSVAQQLRMILIGPPGAGRRGQSRRTVLEANDLPKERALKLPTSRRNTAHVTWYVTEAG